MTGLLLTISADLSWGIALYELIYFVFPTSRWWYTIPPFRYTFILGVVLIVAFIIKNRSSFQASTPLFFPQTKILIIMIGLMGMISFWAVWPEQHIRFLVLQIQQLIFMTIAYKAIDTEEKFNRIVWAYIAGCFYIGYIAHGMVRDEFGRLEGIGPPDGPDANTTAAVLITSIPLIFYYIVYSKKFTKVISLVCVTFISNAIILLNSRGAILGIVSGLIWFLFRIFVEKNIKMQKKIFVFLLFSCVVLIFLYLADPTFWRRMSTMQEIEVGTGTATRIEFWKIAWELAVDNPMGIGARGFEYLSPTILPQNWLSPEIGMRSIHSLYFQAISDFGYVGILLLVGFVGSTFIGLNQVSKKSSENANVQIKIKTVAFESSFAAFLMASIFLDRLYAESFYWLMLFAAIHRKLEIR